MAISIRRKAAVYAAWWGYLHRDEMHYTQDSRRTTDQDPPPNFPSWTDCSGFAAWCYHCAHAPYPGGWTGDMQKHGREVVAAMVRYADLVFFGNVWSESGHVGVVVAADWMIDFGGENGPYHQKISQASRPVALYRTYPM